jgi:putative membrane protein
MASLVDKCLSAIDLKAIEDAVRKAESGTSGELAVTITPRSRHWVWERVQVASIVGTAAMLVSLWVTRRVEWGVYYNFTQALLWGIVGFGAAYFLSRPVLMRKERTRRIVWKHALKHFEQLPATKGKTAVLIFVSLEECQAAIVADIGIASKLSADHWHTPHGMIVSGMLANRHAEGIIQAIEAIAVELARHFPRSADDQNELPDNVTIDET